MGCTMATVDKGNALIGELKTHVLLCLRLAPFCEPGGAGLGNTAIEELTGLALCLPYQDHWLCFSILHSLAQEGLVEVFKSKAGRKRFLYRLSETGVTHNAL